MPPNGPPAASPFRAVEARRKFPSLSLLTGRRSFRVEARFELESRHGDPPNKLPKTALLTYIRATFGAIPDCFRCEAKAISFSGEAGMADDTSQFAQFLGQAAVRLWPALPRNIQEQLFEDAVGTDRVMRHRLALYRHGQHPRTAHPPKPGLTT